MLHIQTVLKKQISSVFIVKLVIDDTKNVFSLNFFAFYFLFLNALENFLQLYIVIICTEAFNVWMQGSTDS